MKICRTANARGGHHSLRQGPTTPDAPTTDSISALLPPQHIFASVSGPSDRQMTARLCMLECGRHTQYPKDFTMPDPQLDPAMMAKLASALSFICGADHACTLALKKAAE